MSDKNYHKYNIPELPFDIQRKAEESILELRNKVTGKLEAILITETSNRDMTEERIKHILSDRAGVIKKHIDESKKIS